MDIHPFLLALEPNHILISLPKPVNVNFQKTFRPPV